jgi:site-specific DNA recombinase
VQWHFQYGYTITKDDVKINPKQAEIVKEIFRRAIDGETFGSIARDLNERGDYTFFGNKWTHCRITEVLSDIRYTGDAILQKTFVNNHIEKKVIRKSRESSRSITRKVLTKPSSIRTPSKKRKKC